MQFVKDDGGRETAGYRGEAGDCVTRSIAIAAQLPYEEVYAALSHGCRTQRKAKHAKHRKVSARNGVYTSRKWFKDYMVSLGFKWVPTMQIGSGCKVHLHDGELPMGRLVVSVSRHYTAVIGGVIHDTNDPQREVHCSEPYEGQAIRPDAWVREAQDERGRDVLCWVERRCVYGYWEKIA